MVLGSQLFDSTNNPEKQVGALLIIANSIMVLFIGILLRKTLIRYNYLVGDIYLLTRLFEAIALSSSIVVTTFLKVNLSDDFGYYLAMLVLGIGSIPMCLTLYKHKISPPWLAIWGAIGYAVFCLWLSHGAVWKGVEYVSSRPRRTLGGDFCHLVNGLR
jgi:hypothetical protein